MITTKTGGKDSKNLSFNANYGFQMPGRLIETMSHDQFIDYINSAYMNSKRRLFIMMKIRLQILTQTGRERHCVAVNQFKIIVCH